MVDGINNNVNAVDVEPVVVEKKSRSFGGIFRKAQDMFKAAVKAAEAAEAAEAAKTAAAEAPPEDENGNPVVVVTINENGNPVVVDENGNIPSQEARTPLNESEKREIRIALEMAVNSSGGNKLVYGISKMIGFLGSDGGEMPALTDNRILEIQALIREAEKSGVDPVPLATIERIITSS